MDVNWNLINAIESHLSDHPTVPSSSWHVTYTEDIRILLQIVKELDNELRREKSRSEVK